MLASVYIKDGNIHFYNEGDSLSNIGGLAYELGKPLLNFICYEPERFDEGLSGIAEAFEIPGGTLALLDAELQSALTEIMTELQTHEIYVYFYARELLNAIRSGEPPREAVARLSDDFRQTREFMMREIETLLALREEVPKVPPMEYLYRLDETHKEKSGGYVYLEKPFRAFYGVTKPPEIVELYGIDSIRDLLRFEFVKMIERDIFIKKCKNCGWFFIPSRRADAEYCDRGFGDTGRRCSEIGATLRYEKKVAGNPILEAHKKAYRRFNSRTRAKKMTQSEFMRWSEQAAQKRDECLTGELAFDEFVTWLEQGRIRKPRSKKQQDTE